MRRTTTSHKFRVIITDTTSTFSEVINGSQWTDSPYAAIVATLERFADYRDIDTFKRIKAWLTAQISTTDEITTITKFGDDYGDYVRYIVEKHRQNTDETVFCELSAEKLNS